jgi:hypothetical protein
VSLPTGCRPVICRLLHVLTASGPVQMVPRHTTGVTLPA